MTMKPTSVSLLALPLLALASWTLAGCADRNAELALAARPALVGLPKAVLLSCAGVPDRSAQSNGLEFLTYEARTITSYAYGLPSSRTCDTTLTLRNGVVEQVSYSGDYSPSACYATVRSCVPPARIAGS